MTVSALRRWVLLTVLIALGAGYIAAYMFFVARSENFITAQRNRKAAESSRSQPVALPVQLTFGRNGNANTHLGGGWMTSSRGDVWLMVNDAWIVLAVPHSGADLRMTLALGVSTSKAMLRNRVEVSVNGRTFAVREFDHSHAGEVIETRVPHSLVEDDMLQVRIHADHVASSFRQELSGDWWGVMLSGLIIEEVRNASDPSGSESKAVTQ